MFAKAAGLTRLWLVPALAGAALCTWALWPGRSGGAGAGRAASTTATATASASSQLADAAKRQAEAMLAKVGEGYRAVVRPPFVVIGNLPEAPLKQMTEGSVLAPAQAMWNSYFAKRPDEVITVLLFDGDAGYRQGAKKIFGDTDVAHFGYYRRGQRALVMNIATGTGTLVHELTHALIVYDFPDVPAWFNEGLGSLHEQCQVQPERIVGLVNWRLPALQQTIRDGKLRPLRELVAGGDFYGPQQGINYAQARYFVMYMQHRDLLGKFYKHFRQYHDGQDAAVKAIEGVFKRDIDAVQAEWLKWVMTLRF